MDDGWIRDANDGSETDELYLPELQRRVRDRGDETDALADRLETEFSDVERVLDLACGPGVHAVALAERGFSVWGIDISPAYVRLARENAGEADVSERTTFRVRDMRALDDETESTGGELETDSDSGTDLPTEFDAVTNRYNSFGYFSDQVNRAIVESVYRRLRPGGVFVLELRNREWLATNCDRHSVRTLDGQDRVCRREYDPETGRLREQVDVYERGGEHRGSYSTDVRLYAPVEIRRLFEAVGFDVTLAGGLDGRPLDESPEWFVVFGEKS